MRSGVLALAVIAAPWLVAPATAHHSHANYELTRTTDLRGVVTSFRLVNPHSWLYIKVTAEEGRVEEWALEMDSPSQLLRSGWTAETLAPGAEVGVSTHQLVDGSTGGLLVSVTLPGRGRSSTLEDDDFSTG